ncbi:MAG: ribosomal RNA small subunit methyltransferase A [Desulfobacteraceae bacterium]|nr:MAG: ribosomal RNA small subunit methyltransferase A [Desulfobacteraceae bacterium]
MVQIKKVNQGLIVSKALLSKSGIRPRKRLGQNFLEDPAIIEKIITHARFDKNDVVVEIGSGLGALTIPIISNIYHLVAIEKDPLLITILKERLSLKEKEKITFISGDVLKLDFKEIYDKFKQKLQIVGNLPYNISSPFLEKLIINRNYIKNAILMFQYEFAQRLTATPKGKEYGALSVISQYYAQISPLLKIKRDAFYPKPKVDSMVLEIDFKKPHPFQAKNEVTFRKTVKAAFSCRRKTILNSLERGMVSASREMIAKALTKCLIDPKRRAETLTIDEYIHLSSVLMPDKTIP